MAILTFVFIVFGALWLGAAGILALWLGAAILDSNL